MPFPREHHFKSLSAHGFHRVVYREWGESDNQRVVVCVHGLTRNGRDFDFLAQRLAARFRVLCPDMPGRGDSEWLRDPNDYAFPTYLTTLTAMLALFRATRRGGNFVRTPKHGIEQPGQEWRDQAYVRAGDPRALVDALFGLSATAVVQLAAAMHQGLLAVYASMFALGFLTLASLSAVNTLQVLALRNLGRRALSEHEATTVRVQQSADRSARGSSTVSCHHGRAVVVGDDHLHTITVPIVGKPLFFRLKTQ